MIEIFNPVGIGQTAKHFSTLRTTIPVFEEPTISQTEEFCTCIAQCIPDLKMLTDEIGTDLRRNDFHSVYQNSVPSGSHTVNIIVEGVEILVTDDTYGKLFNGSAYYGYKFEALKIWTEHGYGVYKFVIRNYNSFATLVAEEFSPQIVLKKYTDREANGTVRITSKKSGTLRHGKKYFNLTLSSSLLKPVAFWEQQIRLPGSLKWTGTPLESMGVVQNSLLQPRSQTFDTLMNEYNLTINLVSSEQALAFLYDDLFANKIYVTDYNVYNWEKYTDLQLRRVDQSFNDRMVKKKSFVIKMVNAEEKFEKFND